MQDDSSPLARFATNQIQLSIWMEGFKSVLFNRELKSHTFAKQVYFPNEDGTYHLLAPLHSSSLSQAIFEQIMEDRFSEKAVIARECKKKRKMSDAIVIDYPALAIQKFGGSKPQNISKLNTHRRGESFLFRSVPPIWNAIKKPPMKKNEFWKSYERRASILLKEFRLFLNAINECDNNDNNRNIRGQRKSFTDQLIDLLFQMAAEIQSMKPGWSKSSMLPLEEKIWLDPLRDDLVRIRNQENWRYDISSHFASWIIQKLKNKNTGYSDDEYEYFKSACLKALKEIE
jgi:CRISPR-associated protein Csy1